MHKIPVGGDLPGLLFVLVTLFVAIGLVPLASQIVVLAIPLGILIAVVLRRIHRRPDVHPLEHL
jgi:hypothetical protein